MLGLILGASALLAGPAAAKCTREVLGQVASKFLNTLTQGSPFEVASPFTYTENFKDASFTSGVFSKTIKVAHNRTLLDGPGCAIYVEIIAPENKPGYHIGTQITVGGRKVIKVEAIINSDVQNSNSWYYNGTRTLGVILQEEKDDGRIVIPEAKRDSRATLKQVADDYFGVVNGSGNGRKMPKMAPGCTRSEGGYPKTIPCTLGSPSNSSSTSSSSAPKSTPFRPPTWNEDTAKGIRSYVIDETVGTVEVFAYFAGAAPDTHDFRVENGMVRYVHTITVMSVESRNAGKSGGATGAPKGTVPKGGAAL